MQKLVNTLIATGLLLGLGTALGQASSHDVEIRIPNALMLRITDGSGNDPATNPRVVFDYQAAANVEAYLTAVNSGAGVLAPTSVANFDDVIVFSNRNNWRVTVAASNILFTDNLGLSLPGAGVALSDIRVDRPAAAPHASVTSIDASWSLTNVAANIAAGNRTAGWRSLGFGGDDYRFAVNGDEDPGTYTTVVTYTIAAP